jgi:membrane-bound ClpP family serine protease
MNKRLTQTRFIMAVISTGLEEVALWLIWKWVLPDAGIKLPAALLITVMALWAAVCAGLFIITTRALSRKAHEGLPSLVGMRGKAASALKPEGQVKIKGELWGAVTEEGETEAGEDIVVTGQRGLKLVVRKNL